MSIRQAEGVSIMQALAMTVAEIPVFLYSTFGQVHVHFITHFHAFLSYHSTHTIGFISDVISIPLSVQYIF